MQRKEVVRNNFNDSPYPYVKIINHFFTHLQVKMQIINVRDVNAREIIIPTRDIVFKDCFSSNTSRNKHLFVSLQDQKLRIIMHQYIKRDQSYRRVWPHQNGKICQMVAPANCPFMITFVYFASFFCPFAFISSKIFSIM